MQFAMPTAASAKTLAKRNIFILFLICQSFTDRKSYFLEYELDVFPTVYGPREDSLLLAESIDDATVKGRSCLDVGCGSGIQAVNLALKGAAKVVAVDVNERAVENTLHNAKKLGFGETI